MSMEKTAYGLLILFVAAGLIALLLGAIDTLPFALMGLVAFVAMGLLFIKTHRDRAQTDGGGQVSDGIEN